MTLRNAAAEADARRQQLANLDALAGGDFDEVGHVPIAGAGESISEIAFNVRFRELPIFRFGFSMGDNETYEMGALPTGSAVVVKWLFDVDRQTTARIYTGAHIAWVTTGGRSDSRWLGHFTFSGRALTNLD